MRFAVPLVFSMACVALAACGSKEAPVEARGASGTVAAAPNGAQAVEAPNGAEAVEPAQGAGAEPAAEAAAGTAEASARAAVAAEAPIYLVWTSGEDGDETVWLAPGAQGEHEALARRPQVVAFAEGTLWGLEEPKVTFRAVTCQDFNDDVLDRPGPPATLPYLAARGLAGARKGAVAEVTSPKSQYFDGEADAKGVYRLIGEHWGRKASVAGGWPGVLMAVDCEGAYSCGAHGDHGCRFATHRFGAEAGADPMPAVTEALAGDTEALLKTWKRESEGEVEEAAVKAVYQRVRGGRPTIEYVLVADTSYAAGTGDWGSYTQTRSHFGPAVAALGMPAVPEAVAKQVARLPERATFGWSVVPPGAAAEVRAAFEEVASVRKREVEPRERAEAVKDTATVLAKVNEGRALTKAKRYADAIGAFDVAIAMDSASARAWSGRGYAKLLAGDLQGAEADLREALKHDASAKFQAAVSFNLGEVAERRGDRAAAVRHYERALELAPSDAARRRLEALRGR